MFGGRVKTINVQSRVLREMYESLVSGPIAEKKGFELFIIHDYS